MFRKSTILIVLLIVSQQLLAQEVSFKTTVSKDRLGLNERLRITFSINKQGSDDFTPPNFRNFKVLAGPMQSTNFSYGNGKQSFEQSYTYTIQPIKKGVFKIPSATIKYDGNIIKTNTVKIRVTGAVEIPKDPNDPRYIASQNIHLVAEISNTNPYVGESISVVYKIYVDVNKVSVRNTREVESPSFNGFWNQNIEVKRWEAKEGSFQGRSHRYAIIKKTVLIPQKAGKLIIDPMEIEISAGVPIGRRDLFGNMISNNTTLTLTTGKRVINAKPLPIENKPANFSGAVGDYDFKVTSSKTELKANESTQIKVAVSGKGNLKLVGLPGIETPNGLERYEPENKENIVTTLGGLRGSIYDQYTVVPQFRGKFKIPPVSFSYFSLEDKEYKTITSNAIIINVPQGKIPTQVDNVTTGIVKRNVISNAKDIRYISTTANLKPIKNKEDFLGSNLFYTLLVLPLLSIPLGIFIGMTKKKRDSDIVGNRRRKADKLAKKYLSEAKKQLNNNEQFYIALEKALHNYLKAKLQVETTDISKEKISTLLQKRNVDTNTINDFIKVLDDCDYARYTPTTNVMMQQEYDKARIVIAKIDKQL
ncbi:MAG: BatD family protein [Flavobacteriaceae bacterium]|nr:BatD family protein [Flavobacteriaceae bacterium]